MISRWIEVADDGAIVIPADFLAEVGWRIGDDVAIDTTNEGLVIRRIDADEA